MAIQIDILLQMSASLFGFVDLQVSMLKLAWESDINISRLLLINVT